jgi:CHAT domain-containing protein
MLEPIIPPKELINAVRLDDERAIEAFLNPLAQWEHNVLSGISFIKSAGSDINFRLLGVQVLATFLRNNGDLISALPLAEAVFDELENDEQVFSEQRLDLTLMAANLLDVLVTGLVEVGHAHRLVEKADRWAEWVNHAHMEDYYLGQVRLGQAEALMLAGDYDHARAILLEVKQLALKPAQIPVLQRLVAKMPTLLRAIDEPEPPPLDLNDMLRTTLEVLKDLTGDSIPGRSPDPRLPVSASPSPFQDIASTAARFGYFPPQTDLGAITQQAENLKNARNPNGTLMAMLQGISSIFMNDRQGNDPAILTRLITPLKDTREYAKKLDFWEHQMEAGWMQAIAFKRLGDFEKSAEVLRELRQEIDRKRLAIADPRNRAGISVYLKHLFGVSAEVLYALGDNHTEELFHVIENAKSKILAELSGSRSFAEKENSLEERRAWEKKVLSKLQYLLQSSAARVGYVSLLLNDDATYAVFLNQAGNLHPRKITLTKVAIDEATLQLAELANGSSRNLAMSRPIDPDNPWERSFSPIIEKLAPLADALSEFVDGMDLLCISPDGSLFNVPFQMLEAGGDPLVSRVGLSVVPSAEILLYAAGKREKQKTVSKASAFLVPQEGGEADLETPRFREITDSLARYLPTAIVSGQGADLERIKKENLSNQLVFLAAHGEFRAADPLGASGLYFARDGQLPGEASDRRAHLLSPKEFSRLNLHSAHVCLLACVSGLTVEITSREALGMIWSSFIAGASSTMAAAWRVDLQSATELVKHIYGQWIEQKRPLWEACRKGMLHQRASSEKLSHPYHWAPFVLYGYWE